MILDAHGRPWTPPTQLRRELGEEVKGNMRQFLVDTIHDRLTHAKAIADGPTFFRGVFVRQLGGFFGNSRGQCDLLANVTFEALKRAWRDRYPDISPEAFLDAVHVPIPETEAERQRAIDDAWEVEIASDESTMRQFYEGSARVRKGVEQFSTAWQKPQRK